MKEVLLLCKKVHFTYSNGIYQQNDDVAMGLPLGSVFAGIFMVELETPIILTLGRPLLKWKRYVDNIFCYMKIGTVNDILNKSNGFHQNIKFTYELEKNNNTSFLDILLIRNKDMIETTVYRNPTNSDIYLNLKLFSPCSWKCGFWKTIIRRTYLI